MSRHRTVITPASGWIPIRWAELWQYRSLLWVFTWRDIKVRYKQTLLGFAWAVISPVMSMVVFTVIFGKLAGFDKLTGDTPYQLVVFAGLLPWAYFSGSLGRAGNSLVSNAHIVTKVYFPRLLIPVSTLGSGLVDFAIALVVFVALAAWYGIFPLLAICLIPFILLGVSALAVGVGMIF
ncbi:MAG: phosphate ABC transporter permease, partial [Zetaproteobacteria bacterium CG_4_10_14_3_um_filter_54_28]